MINKITELNEDTIKTLILCQDFDEMVSKGLKGSYIVGEETDDVPKIYYKDLGKSQLNFVIESDFIKYNGLKENGGGGGSVASLMTEITYAELKSLVDSGQLIPGMQYRITDYETTTTQTQTRSAGHNFDIIVTADNDHTLNENARACNHKFDLEIIVTKVDSDTINININGEDYLSTKNTKLESTDPNYEPYDFNYNEIGLIMVPIAGDINVNNIVKGLSDKEGVSPILDITLYDLILPGINYFSNSNLAAWELKYDINNDQSKYHWADPLNGKGVIYRMKDEFNNSLPYDFKNIQYYINSYYVYTFYYYDASNGVCTDLSLDGDLIRGNYFKDDLNLQKNVSGYSSLYPVEDYRFINNEIGSDSTNNNFIAAENSKIGSHCHDNDFVSLLFNTKIGDNCSYISDIPILYNVKIGNNVNYVDLTGEPHNFDKSVRYAEILSGVSGVPESKLQIAFSVAKLTPQVAYFASESDAENHNVSIGHPSFN